MDGYLYRRKMSVDLPAVSVVDVYDHAAGIGKELEKVIEVYGVESVLELTPKMVGALELLEALAVHYEQEKSEVIELKYTIEKLETERDDKAREKLRYEQDVLLIEENWRTEVNELLGDIDQLQAENRHFHNTIEEQQKMAVAEVSAAMKKKEEKEIKVLTKLKETVDKQRGQIRMLKKEVERSNADCEALQEQLDRIIKINGDLRHKNLSQRKQTRSLLEEKLELQTEIQDRDSQIMNIKEFIKERDSNPALKSQLQLPSPEVDDMELPCENDRFVFMPQESEDVNSVEEKLENCGKLVIDLSDPNRPRFTLKELKEVLQERNELKVRVMELEEELKFYKSREQEVEKTTEDKVSSEEEGAVEGPINKEPYEKLYPKRESGIRKFFRFLVGRKSHRGSFSTN